MGNAQKSVMERRFLQSLLWWLLNRFGWFFWTDQSGQAVQCSLHREVEVVAVGPDRVGGVEVSGGVSGGKGRGEGGG